MKPPSPRPFASHSFLLIAAFAALACAGCQRPGPHNRVAVLDFENHLPPESSTALVQSVPQRLSEYLVNQGGVWVIPRPEVDAKLRTRTFRTFIRSSQSHLKKLGKKLKADYLILGSVSKSNQDYVIGAELFSVATGRPVPGTAATRYAARDEDIEPNLYSLARFMAYQVANYQERERLANTAAFTNTAPPSIAPAPADPVPPPPGAAPAAPAAPPAAAPASPAPAAPAPAAPQGTRP